MNLNLAWVVLVILSITSLKNAGAQTGELQKIRLSVFRIDAASSAARAQGFFAQEGLAIEVTETGSSTEQMRGLSQGKFDAITGSFDNVLAWSGREGAGIVAVA